MILPGGIRIGIKQAIARKRKEEDRIVIRADDAPSTGKHGQSVPPCGELGIDTVKYVVKIGFPVSAAGHGTATVPGVRLFGHDDGLAIVRINGVIPVPYPRSAFHQEDSATGKDQAGQGGPASPEKVGHDLFPRRQPASQGERRPPGRFCNLYTFT
jgi:hypothetical protein